MRFLKNALSSLLLTVAVVALSSFSVQPANDVQPVKGPGLKFNPIGIEFLQPMFAPNPFKFNGNPTSADDRTDISKYAAGSFTTCTGNALLCGIIILSDFGIDAQGKPLQTVLDQINTWITNNPGPHVNVPAIVSVTVGSNTFNVEIYFRN